MTTSESESTHRSTTGGEGESRVRQAILAAGVGNALEWYDFAAYAFVTPVIAKLFFPTYDPVAGIIATFAVFAVGFGMRPIGAVIFGHTADRFGRKLSMVVLAVMMGLSTIVVGLLPTYASIGIAAPALLLVARLFQGLALGGEYGTATSFLVEYARTGRRGLIGSTSYVTIYVGNLLGGCVVLLTTAAVSAPAFAAWGWRIPFLLGFPILLLGLYMRARVDETPQFRSTRNVAGTVRAPLLVAITRHWRAMVLVLGINICLGISAYTVLSFMQTYLASVLHYQQTVALLSVLIGILCGAVFTLIAGRLSDAVGARTVLWVSCVGVALFAYPSYLLLDLGSFAAAVGGQVLLWIPVAGLSGTVPVVFAELFPAEVRVSGFGVAYALGTAIFSGTTPFLATLLVRATGSALAPAWYLAGAAIVTLAFLAAFRETANNRDQAQRAQITGQADENRPGRSTRGTAS